MSHAHCIRFNPAAPPARPSRHCLSSRVRAEFKAGTLQSHDFVRQGRCTGRNFMTQAMPAISVLDHDRHA
jgi:hypothetical protein